MAATETTSAQLDSAQFLKLFMTQLQNQDPLSPMDATQMTAQLAQLSTVESLNSMGSQFSQMLQMERPGEAREMIGHEIEFVDPETGTRLSGVAEAAAVSGDSAGVMIGETFVDLDAITAVGVPASA